MALPRSWRSLRLLALPGLLSISAGCAQLQFQWGGPGAPGSREEPPPLVASQGRGRHELPELPPAPPFSLSDRERIAQMQPWVEQTAARHDLDPDLINGVIWVESRFQPRAQSPAGARGLMQLMPGTAAEMAKEIGRPVARVYDPELNIEMGTRYLLHQLDRFDGDETLALAAYNAGAGNVSKWMEHDGELPPRSLQYVENVQRARLRFVAMRDERLLPGVADDRTLLASAAVPAEPRAEVPPPPGHGEARSRPTPTTEPEAPPEPEAEPATYQPARTLEPPLADTPYPPIDEEAEPRSEAVGGRSPAPRDEPRAVPADALPSVLD